MKNMSFQYSQVKELMLLTSRRFNEQPYGQDPPVSAPVLVSTAFAMSNLETFMKEPLYKSTPGATNKESRGRGRYRDHHIIQKGEESCRRHHRHPFLHLSHSHLLVILISAIGNIVRIFDIVI
jgi:hypothetical protein